MRKPVYLLFVVAVMSGCVETPAERYKALEKSELERGVRYDSLFKGLYFGMKYDDFRAYCYRKNTVDHDFKVGGLKSSWVECKLPTGMDYPAAINFYPEFAGGVISEMNASVYYDNAVFKDGIFEPDSLLMDVLDLMKQWYGKDFIKITSPDPLHDDIYVSIQGNRRLTVYPSLSAEVKIWMVDLYNEKGKKRQTN